MIKLLFGTTIWLLPSLLIGADVFVAPPFALPSQATPGEFLELDWVNRPRDSYLTAENRNVTWYNRQTAYIGVATLPSVTVFGRREFDQRGLLHTAREVFFTHTIKVALTPLTKSQSLRLPADVKARLASFGEQKVHSEFRLLHDITTDIHGPLNFDECWHLPLRNTHVTSAFASPRTPPGGKPYYHTGVDLHAPMHSSVLASASGRVVYEGESPLTGQIIILDHGGGIYSEYMHLSKFLAKRGDRVHRGQLIACSGATGRVEAPHLHWELSWQGIPLDPMRFLQTMEPLCDQE